MAREMKTVKKSVMLGILLVFIISLITLMPLDEKRQEEQRSHITANTVAASASVINSAPSSTITTHSIYLSRADNVQQRNFSICNNENSITVYMLINVTDRNSINEVFTGENATYNMFVKNATSELGFDRFGSSYLLPVLEETIDVSAFYTASFIMFANDTERKGNDVYAIRSNFSDSAASGNSTVNFTFFVKQCTRLTNESVSIPANTTVFINATQEANSTLHITTNTSINGSVSITHSSTSPVSYTDTTIVPLNKFIDIETSGNINSSLTSAEIRIYYTDAEVTELGVTVANLSIYTWTGSRWNELDNITRNTTEKFISGTTLHFSLFALFANNDTEEVGEEEEEPSTPAAESGTSSGGGGGSGVSSVNVLQKKIVIIDFLKSGRHIIQMKQYDKAVFSIGTETYSFEVTQAYDNSLRLRFYPDEQKMLVLIEEELMIDLNEDGEDDIRIEASKILESKEYELIISRLGKIDDNTQVRVEEMQDENVAIEYSTGVEESEIESSAKTEKPSEITRYFDYGILINIVVIILLVYVANMVRKRVYSRGTNVKRIQKSIVHSISSKSKKEAEREAHRENLKKKMLALRSAYNAGAISKEKYFAAKKVVESIINKKGKD